MQVEYENETKLFNPEEISAMILTKMKGTDEAYMDVMSGMNWLQSLHTSMTPSVKLPRMLDMSY